MKLKRDVSEIDLAMILPHLINFQVLVTNNLKGPHNGVIVFLAMINYTTLPETNIASENRPDPKRKCHFQTVNFQVQFVNFRECNL